MDDGAQSQSGYHTVLSSGITNPIIYDTSSCVMQLHHYDELLHYSNVG